MLEALNKLGKFLKVELLRQSDFDISFSTRSMSDTLKRDFEFLQMCVREVKAPFHSDLVKSCNPLTIYFFESNNLETRKILERLYQDEILVTIQLYRFDRKGVPTIENFEVKLDAEKCSASSALNSKNLLEYKTIWVSP